MFMQMDLFSQFYEQPATSMLVLIGLMLTTGIVKYAFHPRENKKIYLTVLMVELLFYSIFPIGLWIGKILSNVAVALPFSLYFNKTKERYTKEISSIRKEVCS